MCGIAGFVDFTGSSSPNILVDMTDTLHRRGPDDSGYSYGLHGEAQVGLGHRRLSIVDLSTNGHQPMAFEGLTLVYNGEVYNFRELREDLENDGYQFASDCDTEVVLKAFHRWGPDSVSKFNGMFSFVLHDAHKRQLYCVRDRAGVKPLYWYWHAGLFLFASELKAFHQHPSFRAHKAVDPSAVSKFLEFGFIPQPYAIFKHARKARAGTYLVLPLSTREPKEVKYWDIAELYAKPKLALDDNAAVEQLEDLLVTSFKYRMIADVPVGVFLSGGVDSSLVTALLQRHGAGKIRTFTIGFDDERLNEAGYARKVANYLGTEHTEYYATAREASELVPGLPDIYDEPLTDNSVLPTMLVSRIAKEHVKVALSADGGDELFVGYRGYVQAQEFARQIIPMPYALRSSVRWLVDGANRTLVYPAGRLKTSNRLAKLSLLLHAKTFSDVSRTLLTNVPGLLRQTMIRDPSEDHGAPESAPERFSDGLESMLIDSFRYNLTDALLTKVDRATMSVSLEGREPLLDYRLVAFAVRLPDRLKVNGAVSKFLLKKVLYKYVPRKFVDRNKMGFTAPYGDWLRTHLKELVYATINPAEVKDDEVLDGATLMRIRDSFYKGNCPDHPLWTALVYKMWQKRWM